MSDEYCDLAEVIGFTPGVLGFAAWLHCWPVSEGTIASVTACLTRPNERAGRRGPAVTTIPHWSSGRPTKLTQLSEALRDHLVGVLAEVGGSEHPLELAPHQGLTRRVVAAP